LAATKSKPNSDKCINIDLKYFVYPQMEVILTMDDISKT
jgi:hypothetical protein